MENTTVNTEATTTAADVPTSYTIVISFKPGVGQEDAKVIADGWKLEDGRLFIFVRKQIISFALDDIEMLITEPNYS